MFSKSKTLAFIFVALWCSTAVAQMPFSSMKLESTTERRPKAKAASKTSGGSFGRKMVTLKVKTTDGKTFVGRPEYSSDSRLFLMRRDGRMQKMYDSDIESTKRVSMSFEPKTAREIRSGLMKEFGSSYEVSITPHFVVVHPKGAYSKWALPFETLYQRFCNYFSARGLTVDKPEFPMVAVVLKSRRDYNRAVATGTSLSSGTTVGFYKWESNRIVTYDQTAAGNGSWVDTLDTVLHEAVHQTAANTGIHSRYWSNPTWVVEGLATMFEAKGVNNYMEYPELKHKINWERLRDLRHYYKRSDMDDMIKLMVMDDRIFRLQQNRAYALSWGLTFYLSERYPQEFVSYLKAMKDDPTINMTPSDRAKLFTRSFGSFSRIEDGVRSFVKGLPK